MVIKNMLYHERLERYNTAVAKGTPDRVPVFPIIEQWAQQVTGISIRDSYLKNPMLEVEAFKKIYERVYVDVSYGTGNLIPLKMMSNFGEGIYQVTEAGVQIKGSHGATMNDFEYSELIENPKAYIMEKVLPRKYPILKQNQDIVAKTWKKSMFDFLAWTNYEKKAFKVIEEKLGVPVVTKGATFLPPDILLDFLRDFVGTTGDIRRRPQEFIDACDALFPMMFGLAQASNPKPDKSTMVFIPLHLPTYLKPKDFEKFYFPSMKKMTTELLNSGRRVMYYMENDWLPYLDLLQDLPDGDIFGMFEGGNLKTIKDKIGNKFCIGGGMPVNILKHGTVSECVDVAKKCLDELAPGGGYIFGLDMNLLNKDDAKIENLAAVCEYVHVNGKY
ncbi:MAG: uroporphyrinogen decarboxylase family protein [Eubacteriales bacterium]